MDDDVTAVLRRAPQRRPPNPPPPGPPAPGGRSAVLAVAPPLVLFALLNLVYAVAAWRGGYDFFAAGTHALFDGRGYLQIAQDGYDVFSCGRSPTLARNYGADSLCGNAGWFPLYSALVAALSAASGLSVAAAGVLVAEAALLAALLLAGWLLVRVLPGPGDRLRPWAALGALTLAALVPAGVYFVATFPMSLAVALSLAYVLLVARGRWVAAGLAGAAAAATYPVAGIVVVVGLAVVVARARRREAGAGRTAGALAAVTLLPAAGLAAVFGYLEAATGRWDAYFAIQSHYRGNRGHNPVATFAFEVTRDARVWVADPPAHLVERLHPTVRLSMWVALGLVLLVLAAAAVAARRRRLHPVDAGLAVFTVAMFLAPLVVGNQIVQYRSHLLLVPGLLVLRHLPAWVLWPVAVALLPLAYRMATLFFPGLLT